ncbi:hypothetical protein C8F01DRAFT_748594 [Mycena amicta]|nr:hypothetical protein C8F01DRAFT_748594 [Mycena amicta]
MSSYSSFPAVSATSQRRPPSLTLTPVTADGQITSPTSVREFPYPLPDLGQQQQHQDTAPVDFIVTRSPPAHISSAFALSPQADSSFLSQYDPIHPCVTGDIPSDMPYGMFTPTHSWVDLMLQEEDSGNMAMHTPLPLGRHSRVVAYDAAQYPMFIHAAEDANLPHSAQAEFVFPNLPIPGAWAYAYDVQRPPAPAPAEADWMTSQQKHSEEMPVVEEDSGEVRIPHLSSETGHCGVIFTPKPRYPEATWGSVISELEHQAGNM